MNKLPKKPSDLIRVALKDLAACEADKRYKINMSSWHNPEETPLHCEVCLAGSVMAKSLGADIEQVLDPNVFSKEVPGKLFALDLFRLGDVLGGLNRLGLSIPKGVSVWHKNTAYQEDAKQFKTDMLALAAELESHGL